MEPATKKARRRVPDDLRQRASVSCDRCKTRKIRCIRLGEPSDPCAACAQQRLDCTASLPRKQRIYASYDQLRSRYCALDMLVKRMFPEEKIDTVEEITDLARRQGVDLIGFEENKGALNPLEEEDETTVLSAVPGKDDRLYDSVQQLHIPEGSLIPAPKGGFHYVGPASSYVFANTIRQLVKKSSAYHLAFDRTGYRRQQRAAEFTSSNRTTALEARIQGHPVTTAEDEETPNSDVFHTEGQSPMDRATPRSIPRSITRWTIDLLPTRLLSDKLVTAFFDRVHPNFALFDRSAFQDQYEDVWKKKSISEALDPGWLCVLYMIYVLGAQSLERDGLTDAMTIQSRYLAMVVRDGLQRLVLTATQSNVQALALLSLYQHNAGERNTAWMLIGHASRMAIGLGMQRDGEGSNYTFNIRNLRRLIWWTLYLFEQTLSFVLGRPSATSTVDISAHLPDETILDGSSAPLGYLEHAVKLGAISAKVKRFIASVSTDYDKPEKLAKTADMANQLDQILVEWESSLPLHLKADSHYATQKHARAVLLLHATHSHIRSVNGRPYLLCQTNRDLDNRTSVSPQMILNDSIGTLARTSTTAARSCMELLIRLANLGQLEGELWYDFYYVHHASLILSLPFLAKPNDPTFQMDRATISTALNLAQRVRLAPTYRILINVSIQFAKIVGIGPEDDPSRPPSPFLGSLPSHRPSQASLNDLSEIWTLSTGTGTEESFNNAQTTLSSDSDYTTQQTGSWASMIPSDAAGREAANPHPWSLIPILDPNLTTQPLSLEQLLGLPQSNVTDTIPPLDMAFSDLHNFGLGASLSGDGNEGWATAGTSRQDWAGMDMGNFPWDFFGGAISPDEVRPRNQ